jgi:murein L,D-transpeptidase YafK
MPRRILYCLAFWPCIAGAQDDRLPAYVLLLPPSIQTVLIAETDTATLHRFTAGESGLKSAGEQRMSVGENGVGKRSTGDRRTPLGIYFVLEELDTRLLHEKYGPVAFPLDYPNVWDELNGRSGYGIWIHGVTPNSGPRPEHDTDGCIALDNESLLALKNYIAPAQTPVIVTRRLQMMDARDIARTHEQLFEALQSWVASYRDGDWHQYLSLYAEDFTYRGMNRNEWSTFRMWSAGDRAVTDFEVDEVMLLTDPEEPGLYVSRFRQKTAETGRLITVTKRLYWRGNVSGELKIVAEDNG